MARDWQQEGRAAVSQRDKNLPITLLSLCRAEAYGPQAQSSKRGACIKLLLKDPQHHRDAKPILGARSHVPSSAREA